MTTPSLTARNRANAQKSTGPQTATGKTRVAQNARQHGATSKPDTSSVIAWLRIILDDPDLLHSDVLLQDEGMRRALALADAEVRAGLAQASLDQFESGAGPAPEVTEKLQSLHNAIADELAQGDTTNRQVQSGLSLLTQLSKDSLPDKELGGQRHLLLQRYLREAQAKRRRAFRLWLDYLEQEREARKRIA